MARRDSSSSVSPTLSREAVDEVQRSIERVPDRQILNYLVQYFAAEVNWFVPSQIDAFTPYK